MTKWYFFPQRGKKSLRTISLRFYNSCIPGELYKRVGLKPVGSGFYEKTIKGLLEDNLPDIPLQWQRASRYLTRSKQRIVNEIGYEVQSLVENAFLDKSGNSSQLIYGEKGVGKSSALTLSVMGVWLHYGNVIPIYSMWNTRDVLKNINLPPIWFANIYISAKQHHSPNAWNFSQIGASMFFLLRMRWSNCILESIVNPFAERYWMNWPNLALKELDDAIQFFAAAHHWCQRSYPRMLCMTMCCGRNFPW